MTAIRKLGGWTGYDDEVNSPGSVVGPRCSARLRTLLGDDFFHDVVEAHLNEDAQMSDLRGLPELHTLQLPFDNVTDGGMQYLEGLPRLRSLVLLSIHVTDTGLQHLTSLNQLQWLWLDNTQLTDAGLAHIAKLPHLEGRSLNHTQVTDTGLAQLAGRTRFKWLQFDYTRITDVGLQHIKGLNQLQDLCLFGTQVTDVGLTYPRKVDCTPTVGHSRNACHGQRRSKTSKGDTSLQDRTLKCLNRAGPTPRVVAQWHQDYECKHCRTAR